MAEQERSDRVSTAKPCGLWDIYRFSYLLALRSLNWHHARDVARLLIEPCSYWRNVEVPAVVNHLCVRRGERILDVGSPKLASIFLWYRMGVEMYATDLYPYFFDEYSHYLRRVANSQTGASYHIELQDARRLTYPDCYFNKVYAISVVEHIEHEGDSLAVQEIRRVLRPGGICCLTVPFASRYRESSIEYEVYYKDSAKGRPAFYERHYDPQSLQERLIGPSGLTVSTLKYFGERWVPFERLYRALPRILKMLLSPLSPAFARVFLHEVDSNRLSSAKAALIVMRKQSRPFPGTPSD